MRRWLLIVLGLLGVLALLGPLVSGSVAQPSCASGADVWNGDAGDGNFMTAGNWSTGTVPTSATDVCLPTLSSAYTVQIIQRQPSVNSLEIQAGATLEIAGGPGSGDDDGVITTADGVENAGTIQLTNTAQNFSARIIETGGTFTNTGTIDALAGAGGSGSAREIQGNFVNDGTVDVQQSLNLDGTSPVIHNAAGATITIESGQTLTVSGTATFDLDGGTLANSGTYTQTGGVFNHNGGNATGSPLQLEDVALDPSLDNGAGSGSASFFIYDNANTLTGDVASSDTLQVASVAKSGNNAGVLTANTSLTNAGTIQLTETGAAADAQLDAASGTITNTGTISALPGNDGGARDITGNFTNAGTLNIGQSLTLSGASAVFHNVAGGTINIESGETLTVSGSQGSYGSETFDLDAGTIANSGTYQQNGGSFSHNGGSTTGTALDLEDVALNASLDNGAGTGSGNFLVYDNNNTLTGNVAAGDTVTISGEAKSGNNEGVLTASSSFTNAGTIALTANTAGGAELLETSGTTITNDGTIESLSGNTGNDRTLKASLVNAGTLDVQYPLTFNLSGATFTQNAGTTTIAAGQTLSLNGSSGTFTLTGGELTGTGQLTGAVDQTGGTVAPGSSSGPGTLSINGNYTQGSGGTLNAQIDGTTAGRFSALGVAGNADLSGTLALAPSSAYQSAARTGDSDAVLTYGGTLTGNFGITAVSPQNTAAPQVSGSTTVGSTLTCSTGSWTNSPTSFAYQWNRNGTAISGAASATYTVATADGGTTLTCTVTASGAAPLAGGNGFTAVSDPANKAVDARVGSSFTSTPGSATSAGTQIAAPPPPVTAITVSTTTLANAVGANDYGQALTACGGVSGTCQHYSTSAGTMADGSGNPVSAAEQDTFTLPSGALPPGMTLSSRGLLSGTPSETGTYSFSVRVTDPAGNASQATPLSLTVSPGISVTAGSVSIAGALPAGAASVTAGSLGGINAVSLDGGSASSLAAVTGSGVPAGADQIGLQIGHDQTGDCETELQIGNAQGIVFNAANLDISGCDATPAASTSAHARRGAVRTRGAATVSATRAVTASASTTVTLHNGLGTVTIQPAIGAATDCAVASDGNFVASTGTGSCTVSGTGSFTLTVQGGTYTSELNGSAQSTLFQMSSLVDGPSAIPPTMQVTPLTTFVDSLASHQAAATLSAAHQTATSAIMSAYGFPSAATVEAPIPSFAASNTGASALAMSVLGGLESESASLALTDRGALVTALAQQLSDGEFSNPVTEQLGSGTLPATAGTSQFLGGLKFFQAAQQYASSIPPLAPAASTIKEALPVSPLPVSPPIVVAAPTPVGSIHEIGPGAFTETVTAASPSVSAAPFPTKGGATFTIEVVS
ncbi:MAG: beta strand repeat-containing protein [Solirubrobacteraceae bacterium]